MATTENGAPRVRAVRIFKVEDEGIVIQTFKSKDLCRQMYKDLQIEKCFNNFEAGIQVRIRGNVEPLEDEALTKQVLEERPFLKDFVDAGQEIIFFILRGSLAHIWDRSRNFEPKEYLEL